MINLIFLLYTKIHYILVGIRFPFYNRLVLSGDWIEMMDYGDFF